LIHTTLSNIETALHEYKTNNPSRNFRSAESQLLKTIRDDFPSIIFKPADKNLGLVAMDVGEYDQMVLEHLNDRTTYKKVASNSLTSARLLKKLNSGYQLFVSNQFWTMDESKFLKHQPLFKVPQFHCFPKLHKPGRLKGRPIAGAVQWITTPISRILDRRLQPLLQPYDTILLNSEQLVTDITHLNDYLPNGPIYMITGDVSSLYPNIDLDLLFTIVERVDFSLTELCRFVCNNNYVKYGTDVYHQTSGLAMGTNAAVNLANLFMAEVIDPYINSRPRHLLYYKRYIDDLVIFWTGSLEEWSRVAQNINRIHPKIRINFTEPSTETCIFLDLNITWNPMTRKLCTSVYQKELNRYMYISPLSCHVPHVFKGFIYGELTRYCRLSTDVYSYQQLKNIFLQRLLGRGFSRRFLAPIFQKHSWSHRFNERRHQDQRQLLPLVLPFSRRPNIGHLEAIFRNYRYSFDDYLGYSKVALVYSRNANVSDLLTSSSLSSSQMRHLDSTRPRPQTQLLQTPLNAANLPQRG
jgi:hypothetical protein